MTVPLSRILFDRNLPKKLPAYARNLGRRQRKRILLWLGRKYIPQRLLLETEWIINYDDARQSTEPSYALGHNVSGMTNLRVIEPSRSYPLTDPNWRAFLQPWTFPEDSIRSATSFVCELADATIQMDDGIVCTRDGHLLEDSAIGHRRVTISSAYGELKRNAPYLEGTYSSIWGRHGNNHYHWLFEVLPRLYSLQLAEVEPLILLMPDALGVQYKHSLSWFLPPQISVRYVPHASWWHTQSFIFPSYTLDSDVNMPSDVHTHYIRRRILQQVGLPDSNSPGQKRIYVARGDAPFRRMKNEPEVIAMLRGYGFEPYVLEHMSFHDQVHVFADAQCVIGPHGAGLANMLFAGRIPLVELIPREMPRCYFMLARFLGQQYRYVYAENDPGVRGHRDARLSDFTVPVHDVERQVRDVLNAPFSARPDSVNKVP